MKETGIVRRIDDLGRITIPEEIREQLGIIEGDPLEILVDSNNMVSFRKYSLLRDSDVVDAIAQALTRRGFIFSIYDNYSKLYSTEAVAGFFSRTPAGKWQTLIKSHLYELDNKLVIPIILNEGAKPIGFIVIKYKVGNGFFKQDYIIEIIEFVLGVLELAKIYFKKSTPEDLQY